MEQLYRAEIKNREIIFTELNGFCDIKKNDIFTFDKECFFRATSNPIRQKRGVAVKSESLGVKSEFVRYYKTVNKFLNAKQLDNALGRYVI